MYFADREAYQLIQPCFDSRSDVCYSHPLSCLIITNFRSRTLAKETNNLQKMSAKELADWRQKEDALRIGENESFTI